MSSIDERIVSMKFDNASFETGIAGTIKSLEKLNSSLQMKDGAKGLDDVKTKASGLNLDSIAQAAENVSSKLTNMGVIGVTALMNITNRAVDAGVRLANSFTIQPISDGFREYETKIGAINTIMNNTSRWGTTLDQVTESLGALNEYSDKTIYNFGDMVRNIGLFTNAGLKLEESTSMIKGFSNEAAASGTNASQAAGAAYQLSQALSAGTIRLMDWRSLTNVNMGNKNMQEGLVELATAMDAFSGTGTTGEAVLKDFNGSLEKGWLTADVMSKYLQIMAGDMTDAQMAELGLSEAQIASFKQRQIAAEEAATKVRTFTQLMGTMRESIGSGWAQTFEILFGNFDEATDFFTEINDRMSPLISSFSDARNNLLQSWKDMGGRSKMIDTLRDSFQGLMNIGSAVGRAFKAIFPPVTADTLMRITDGVRGLAQSFLEATTKTQSFENVFKGIFAVVHMVGSAFLSLGEFLFGIIGRFSGVGGSILDAAGNLGLFLQSLDSASSKSDFFAKLLDGIENVVVSVANALRNLGATLEGVGDKVAGLGDKLSGVVDAVKNFVKNLKANLGPALGVVTGFAGGIAAVFLALKKLNASGKGGFSFGAFVKNLIGGLKGGIGDFIGNITAPFEQLKGTLKSMQTEIQAKAIFQIAAAVAVLAGALLIISLVDSSKLAGSLAAIGVLIAELSSALVVMSKNMSTLDAAKLTAAAFAMIGISVAITLMALALNGLSNLSWEEIARGLVGLTAVSALMVGVAEAMNRVGKPKGAAKMVIMAIALGILGFELKKLSELSWEEIVRGLTGMVGVAAVLALTAAVLDGVKIKANTVAETIAFAVAMSILGNTLSSTGAMSWEEIARGLTGMVGVAAVLAATSAALSLIKMDASAIVGAVAVAVAIKTIGSTMQGLGSMSFEELGTGFIAMAAGVAVLVAALKLASGSLAGAASLVVAATALSILVPVMQSLGSMSLESIATAILAMAGAFTVLGLAAMLLQGATPVILALSAGVALLGAGLALAGIGIMAFVTAFTMLTAAASVGGSALVLLFSELAAQIPIFFSALALGIVDFLVTLAASADQIVETVTILLTAVFTAIQNAVPQLLQTAVVLITQILDAINIVAPQVVITIINLVMMLIAAIKTTIPALVLAGVDMVLGILRGIRDRAYEMGAVGLEIISEFLRGVQSGIPQVTEQAFQVVLTLINSMRDSINNNAPQLRSAALGLGKAVVDGLTDGITGFADRAISAAQNMASRVKDIVASVFDSHSPSKELYKLGMWFDVGLSNGIRDYSSGVVAQSKSMAARLVSAVQDSFDSSEFDDPTITPIVDLSNVDNAIDSIQSSFGVATSSMAVAYSARTNAGSQSTDGSGSGVQNGGVQQAGIQFVQNNYSPTALSRSEIYRDTKNLISRVKKDQ